MSNPQITIRPNRLSLEVTQRETTIVQVNQQGPPGAPGSSGASYERTFTQADLSIAGVLPITHNLNSFPSGVTIWSASGDTIGADSVEVLTVNVIAIDLQSFLPLQGTWTISVTA